MIAFSLQYYITHNPTGEKWSNSFTESDALFVGCTLENATMQDVVKLCLLMNNAQRNHKNEFKYSLS